MSKNEHELLPAGTVIEVTIEQMIREGSCTAAWAQQAGYKWEAVVVGGDALAKRQKWLAEQSASQADKQESMTSSQHLVWLGHSSDRRTNRWRVTCPVCGKPFEPHTTMFAQQRLQCPNGKCRTELFVNYNEETVRQIS